MATTFSLAFKNYYINVITGRSSSASLGAISYIWPYAGAQPADPTVTPAGASMYASYSNTVPVAGYFTAPASGVCTLASTRSYAAAYAITAGFARIYCGGSPSMDTSIGLSGGNNGVTVPTLTSIAGVAFVVSNFSFKVPLGSGTIRMNVALVNAIASAWCTTEALVGVGSSGSILVYSGTAPSTADLPATGTLLATYTTVASGATWNLATGGSASLVSSLSVNASATGTAGYVRMVKGTYVLQGSVGTVATDFLLNAVDLVSGNSVSLIEATIAM